VSRLSSKHVVLGLLADRTSYGYALQQQLGERFGFLALAESAIYKTLERLEADRYVETAGQRSSGGISRILYRATPDGVACFKEWMAAPSEPSPLRDELHAKLVLAGPDDLPQLLETVEGQAQACLTELAELGRLPRPVIDGSPVQWRTRAQLLVGDFSAHRLESLVDWLAEVAEAIQEQIDAQTSASSDTGRR
jgi:DNA-binding PadR family transcriptional regulator